MSEVSHLFSVSSLAGFTKAVYKHLYTAMTRVLNDMFKKVSDHFYLNHVPLVTRKTQCLLTHMYFYFLDAKFQKSYYRLSDYYLKKHLCDIAYINGDFPKHEFQQRITHRFHHYALRLELIFRSLLPDMLLSLCRLESHSPQNNYAHSRFRLREILITFQL